LKKLLAIVPAIIPKEITKNAGNISAVFQKYNISLTGTISENAEFI